MYKQLGALARKLSDTKTEIWELGADLDDDERNALDASLEQIEPVLAELRKLRAARFKIIRS